MSSREPKVRHSLGFRFVAFMVAAEVVFGLGLGVIVAMFSLRAVARERADSLRDISAVAAASIMPIVAEQDERALNAQLRSLIAVGQVHGIQAVSVRDSAGHVLAEMGEPVPEDGSRGLLEQLTGPRTITHTVEYAGTAVAEVTVGFSAAGIDRSVTAPLLAAGLVVAGVALVSVPWSVWLVLRSVVQPLAALTEDAARVAEGDLSFQAGASRADEIGLLSRALSEMASQLEDKERRLLGSLSSLEEAYRSESRMKDEIEQLMRTKSDFVAVASHELRNPLAVARLYSEMLERGVYGELSPEQTQAVEAVVAAAARLSSIVSDLMDAALLERGELPMRFEAVELRDVVRKAGRDAAALGLRVSVRVSASAPGGEVWVRADRLRIRQVLDNLLSNALKYSPEGETVALWIERDPGTARVVVKDNGPGLEPEDDLFTLFNRSDPDPRHAGLGLGLAISARILQAHDGRLYARRPAGGSGSELVMELAAVDDPDEIRPAEGSVSVT